MAFIVRNAEAERLASELARLTGETKTEAVTRALRDRLARLARERSNRSLADEIDAIGDHCSSLPVLDQRSGDEILGFASTKEAAEAESLVREHDWIMGSEVFGRMKR